MQKMTLNLLRIAVVDLGGINIATAWPPIQAEDNL